MTKSGTYSIEILIAHVTDDGSTNAAPSERITIPVTVRSSIGSRIHAVTDGFNAYTGSIVGIGGAFGVLYGGVKFLKRPAVKRRLAKLFKPIKRVLQRIKAAVR